jgi:hypothetical protein
VTLRTAGEPLVTAMQRIAELKVNHSYAKIRPSF